MNFMNDYDIDAALVAFADDPILLAGAKTLSNLRDLANNVSDGWAYWPRPARAANKLMELLQQASRADLAVTPSTLKRAQAPIRAFLTRENLNCEIVTPY